MAEMKLSWHQNNERYANGVVCRLGKFKVGSAFYSGMISRERRDKYQANCKLPGIESNLGTFPTLAEAQEKVETAVKFWLKNAGLIEE